MKQVVKIIAIIVLVASPLLIAFAIIFFQKQTTQSPAKSQQSISGKSLALNCPVSKNLCRTGKNITYNGNPALAYNLPKGVKITNITQALDSQQFVIQPYKKENPQGLYQSAVSGDNCYTITYTFPSQTDIAKIILLPLEKGSAIATSSANLINIEQDQANLIIQIQERLMDEATNKDPLFQRCSVASGKPEKFGQYQPIEATVFK